MPKKKLKEYNDEMVKEWEKSVKSIQKDINRYTDGKCWTQIKEFQGYAERAWDYLEEFMKVVHVHVDFDSPSDHAREAALACIRYTRKTKKLRKELKEQAPISAFWRAVEKRNEELEKMKEAENDNDNDYNMS